MKHHPLKILSLLSITGLIINQLALVYWLDMELRYVLAAAVCLPLLIPLPGLIKSRRYTYKWTGFLTLPYFLAGVSEAFSNTDLRLYGILTLVFSLTLYVSSMYYSRFLRVINH